MIARLLGLGARAAGGLPLWLWLIAGLLVAIGGVEVTRQVQVSSLRAEVATEKAGRADDRAKAKDAALRQAAINAKETARRLEAQQEVARAYETQLAAATRDAAAARDVSLRLSRQLAAFTTAHRGASGNPPPSSIGPSAESALDLLANLFSRADTEAGELAEYADRARIAGQLCEASYDALTLKKGAP